MGFPNDSTGMVSRRLKSFGSCLSNTLNVDKPCLIFYLSDEIFTLGCPILVTIDAVSTAILRIELASDRTGSTWKQHFSELKDHQFIAATHLSRDSLLFQQVRESAITFTLSGSS
jgi:hypothetical protein